MELQRVGHDCAMNTFNFHVTKLERVGAWSCKCQLLGGVEEPSSSLHKAVTTTDIYLTFHLLHLI